MQEVKESFMEDYEDGVTAAKLMMAGDRNTDWWCGFLDVVLDANPADRPAEPACLDCVERYAKERGDD